MKIKINIRIVVFAGFLFIALIFLGYKYYEWNTLQTLSSLYNQTWSQELNLVQQENKSYITFLTLYKKVFAKDAPKDSLVTSYNELSGDLQLLINSQEEYLSTIQQNQNAYSGINTFFLIDQRGNFAKEIIDDQIKYYNVEIDDAKISDAANWLEFDFLSTWNDMATITKFYDEIGQDPINNTAKYFADLSPIEKYTNSDFQFEHSSDILKYYPDGYAALNKNKDYFVNYYSTAQDYDTGDTQSASYTFSALKDAASNLSFNISDIFKQQDSHTNDNSSKIVNLISSQSNAIKTFQTKKLFNYPLLPRIPSLNADLVLCQLYDFRAGVLHSITTKYITSKSPSDLLNELSSIPPSTQTVDSKFDINTMKIENNDKEIQITCLDKRTNTYYKFVTIK